MPDKFDPYREALVMETTTIWGEEFEDITSTDRNRIAEALHADAENCSTLEYVRVHTGFCRQITVTQDDVDRVAE